MGYFRRRAIAAAVVAGALAIGAIPVLAVDAPILADELTTRGWPFVVASGLLGAAALALLWRDRPRGTRACAVGAVVAVLAGWGVAQYPYILPPTMTFADAAAPAGSLDALLVIFVIAALVIAPSLALLYSPRSARPAQGPRSRERRRATVGRNDSFSLTPVQAIAT